MYALCRSRRSSTRAPPNHSVYARWSSSRRYKDLWHVHQGPQPAKPRSLHQAGSARGRKIDQIRSRCCFLAAAPDKTRRRISQAKQIASSSRPPTTSSAPQPFRAPRHPTVWLSPPRQLPRACMLPSRSRKPRGTNGAAHGNHARSVTTDTEILIAPRTAHMRPAGPRPPGARPQAGVGLWRSGMCGHVKAQGGRRSSSGFPCYGGRAGRVVRLLVQE